MFKTAKKTISRKKAEEAMANYKKGVAQLEMVESQKKLEVNEIETRHQETIKRLSDQLLKDYETIEQYVNENRDELLGDKKSAALGVGTIGFRKGIDKLVLIDDDGNWEGVLEIARKRYKDFVITSYKLDKKKILSELGEDEAKLEKMGVKVSHDEKFFIK